MDEDIFLRGYLTAKALRMRKTGTGEQVGAGSGGAWDKESFLAGMAAGFCADGAVFGDADGTTQVEYRMQFAIGSTYYVSVDGKYEVYNSYGLRLVYNSDGIIAKCGICWVLVTDSEGVTWDYVTMACTGVNLTSVTLSACLAYNNTVTLDGMTSDALNTFAMSKVNGVWSHYGTYSWIRQNITGPDGKPLSAVGNSYSGTNTRLFTNLDEMKAWLAE